MRIQLLYQLLFLWLLLAVFQQHSTITSEVQGAHSVNFKISPAKYSSRSTNGHVLTTLARGRKGLKTPSGPNPVGNQHPPSRT